MKKAVCILVENEDGLILGVSRKDNHSDFGLPGGAVEAFDKSFEDAATRELKEETGLDIKNLVLIFTEQEGEYETKTYSGSVSGTISSNEIGIVKWVTWNDLFNSSFGDYNRKLHNHLNKS